MGQVFWFRPVRRQGAIRPDLKTFNLNFAAVSVPFRDTVRVLQAGRLDLNANCTIALQGNGDDARGTSRARSVFHWPLNSKVRTMATSRVDLGRSLQESSSGPRPANGSGCGNVARGDQNRQHLPDCD